MKDLLRGDPKITRKGIVLSDDLSNLIPLFDESKSSGQEYGFSGYLRTTSLLGRNWRSGQIIKKIGKD